MADCLSRLLHHYIERHRERQFDIFEAKTPRISRSDYEAHLAFDSVIPITVCQVYCVVYSGSTPMDLTHCRNPLHFPGETGDGMGTLRAGYGIEGYECELNVWL